MKPRQPLPLFTCLFAAVLPVAPSAFAETVTKGATGTNLSDGASWGGGVVPGSGDVAAWAGASLGGTLSFAGSTSWQGINYSGASAATVINSGTNNTLTLGSAGVTLSGSQNLTYSMQGSGGLTVAGNADWNIASGRVFQIGATANGQVVELGNFTVNLTGPGTVRFDQGGQTIQNGTFNVNSGVLLFNAGSSRSVNVAASVAINVASGATMQVAHNSGTGSTFNQALTLNGGTLLKSDNGVPTVAFGGTIALGTGGGTIGNGGSAVWSIGSTLSGNGGLTLGSGIVALSGANSNTGVVTIRGSATSNVSTTTFVQVSSIGNGGGPGNLGAASADAANLVFGQNGVSAGQLNYTGAGESTDRLFTLNGHAILVNNGSGALNFTNTGAIAHSGTSNPHSLTLAGTNGGSIASAIGNGAGPGAISINKTGTGQWTLSGANTYTGGTTISAGSLTAGSAGALGSGGIVTLNGGDLLTSVATVSGFSGLTLNNASSSLSLNGAGAGDLGIGAGDLTMSAGSVNIDITNLASFDRLTGSGSFNLTGGTLALSGFLGFEGAGGVGNSYALLDGFSSGSVSGLSITGYDTGNWSASLGNNGVLTFSAIPEPGAAMAGSMGLLALLLRRRRGA